MVKITTEQFIEKAKKVHGDKYDYSKVVYKNAKTKICVICPIHGEFFITPHHHLEGKGCKKCSIGSPKNALRKTTEDFIRRAREIHGDKYDYSKANYVNAYTKVCIICPEHGEFWQSPTGHIAMKEGCPKCNNRDDYTQETWIKKAKEVHGDKYDYSKTKFIRENGLLTITCPKHGDFVQRAGSHIGGCGCRKCATELLSEKLKKGTEKFIEDAKKVHGDKYDYSKANYVNAYTKVCIICPEHGEFWQSPTGHIANLQGCPMCKQSKMEEYVDLILKNNGYEFEREKRFDWLKLNKPMSIDFFFPKLAIAIEVQGGQHFIPVKKFGGEKSLEITQERDKEKNLILSENGIRVIYIVPRIYKKYLGQNEIYSKNVLFKEDIVKNNNILFSELL